MIVGKSMEHHTMSDDLCFYIPFQFGGRTIGVELLITNDTGIRLSVDQTTLLSRTALSRV